MLTGRGDISPPVTAGTSYKLLLLFTIVAGLTCGALAVDVIATLFPRLRGRWVERRYPAAEDLAGDWAAWARSRLAQMQDFVDQHDPSIRLRAVAGDDQLAGVYPVGWRSARIAVFTPLFPLWDQDRAAAQAILGSDQVSAALAAIQSGITADQKATALLINQEKKCHAS